MVKLGAVGMLGTEATREERDVAAGFEGWRKEKEQGNQVNACYQS